MKKIILMTGLVVQVLIGNPVFAQRGGSTHVAGGGDASEIRFDVVANDLRLWIIQGGSSALSLPLGLNLATYNQRMLTLLAPHTVVVAFTSDEVLVSGVSKTCRGDFGLYGNSAQITCNIARFDSTDEAGQYRLVHHEYAGLAGLEQNVGASSDYAISSQITTFLEPATFLHLVPTQPITNIFDENFCATGAGMTLEQAINFVGAGNSERDLGYVRWYQRTRKCDPLTGCGAWKPVEEHANKINLSLKTRGNSLEAYLSTTPANAGLLTFPSPDQEYQRTLTWNNAVTQALTSSGRAHFALTSGDYPLISSGNMKVYFKPNCAKIDFLSDDTQTEYAAYWSF